MGAELLLVIDVGTQSVRALLFDLQGGLVKRVQALFEPYYSEHPGWAEQDPDLFWDKIRTALARLWEEVPHLKKSVQGVSITTQRATVVNVDVHGRPLRAAISWLDQRTTDSFPPVKGLWKALFKVLNLSEMIYHLQSNAEVNWIRAHQPEIWAKTHKFLLLSGYLNYRLTGNYSDSIGSQVGYLPFDYKNHGWAKSTDWKWQALPIAKEKLPDLIQQGELLGRISAMVSLETGIPEGLPVIASAADKACEVLGSGCISPETGAISYGTTATINITSAKYIEPVPLLPPYPAAAPGNYNLEIQIFRGFWLISWFIREFGVREQLLAAKEGVSTEEIFDRLVADIPSGSMGLTLQPFWSPGLKSPGREAKGAIIGFGDVHTRVHIYRSILEGIAYTLREGREQLEKRTKVPMNELRVSGGGSQSRQVLQITADIFNLPAVKPGTYETSGLGAAIVMAVGLGLHRDYVVALKEMTSTGEVFEPNPHNAAIYNELYQKVYKNMYKRVKPLYHSIREITGYPLRPGMGSRS